jgi:hypothetical protein
MDGFLSHQLANLVSQLERMMMFDTSPAYFSGFVGKNFLLWNINNMIIATIYLG